MQLFYITAFLIFSLALIVFSKEFLDTSPKERLIKVMLCMVGLIFSILGIVSI